MEKYIDEKSGELTVVVDDLRFLYDRDHYNWVQRHLRHRWHKKALRKAQRIIAVNDEVKAEITKYYFVPKERIDVSPVRTRE